MSEYHNPVLLNETIDGLNIQPNGVYVDVTFGGGGHSRRILEKLEKGTLVGFDQDADARANADELAKVFPGRSFTFIDSNFRYLEKYLKFHRVGQVDGVLADLGVSSHQFDVADRGFSTRSNGELDMRMDQSQVLSAKTLLNTISEKDLIHLLSMYGEVKNARTLAAAVIGARSEKEIETSGELKAIAETVAPKGKVMKYLAQVFQAIRIEVNNEMDALRDFLNQCKEVIKPGGRLVVISYHSLEDRMVKSYLQKGNVKGKEEKDFYGNVLKPFSAVNRKPILPGQEELQRNNRARSAKLRIAQKN